MSNRGRDVDLARDLGTLIRTLEDLQAELEPRQRRRLGLPAPGDVLRLTSEVAIPAAVLALETNVRLLRIVQRAIRMQTGEAGEPGDGRAQVRARAESIGREAMVGLDEALSDLQGALEGRPGSDDATALLAEARRLQREVETELTTADDDVTTPDGPTDRRPVDVDVEAELASIRDQVEGEADGGDEDGTDDGEDADDRP